MLLSPNTYITPEEYLAGERRAEYKSEYFDGEIFAMAGASERHITIVANVMYLMVGQLKGRDCKAYSNDMKVKVSPTGYIPIRILSSYAAASYLMMTIMIRYSIRM